MAANRACRNGFWAAVVVHMIAFQSWTASALVTPGQIAARATRRTRGGCFLFGLMGLPPAVVSCGHTDRTVLVSWHRVTTDRARKRYKDAKPVRKRAPGGSGPHQCPKIGPTHSATTRSTWRGAPCSGPART